MAEIIKLAGLQLEVGIDHFLVRYHRLDGQERTATFSIGEPDSLRPDAVTDEHEVAGVKIRMYYSGRLEAQWLSPMGRQMTLDINPPLDKSDIEPACDTDSKCSFAEPLTAPMTPRARFEEEAQEFPRSGFNGSPLHASSTEPNAVTAVTDKEPQTFGRSAPFNSRVLSIERSPRSTKRRADSVVRNEHPSKKSHCAPDTPNDTDHQPGATLATGTLVAAPILPLEVSENCFIFVETDSFPQVAEKCGRLELGYYRGKAKIRFAPSGQAFAITKGMRTTMDAVLSGFCALKIVIAFCGTRNFKVGLDPELSALSAEECKHNREYADNFFETLKAAIQVCI